MQTDRYVDGQKDKETNRQTGSQYCKKESRQTAT